MEEHARIKVRIDGTLVQTTVGRVILSEVLPAGMPFAYANKLMTKKEVTKLIDSVYRQSGHRETVMFLDKIKDAGFTYATRAGVTICIFPARRKN
jgi:DNA-directed RNA polymerase subunit beta'